MKPNKQQRAVIGWVLQGGGSLNLVARAGCGKTATLVHGVVRTVVENNLGTVALMAYNKSAAQEFSERLEHLSKETDDRRFVTRARVDPGTVHSFGFRAVRKWSGKVKVDGDKMVRIVRGLSDRDTDVFATESGPILKLVSLAKQSAFGFSVQLDNKEAWFELAEHHAVNELVEFPLSEVIDASIIALKESIKADREVIDFDDMILAPLVHDLRLWTYDWVLIDEAQDTNAARRALALKMLRPKTGRLVAVGDDRQAIYGFTGADHNSLELIRRELDSTVLPLSITYRCPKAVVREANRLVPDLVAHESAPDGVVRSMPRSVPIAEGPEPQFVPWFKAETLTDADAVLCRNTAPLVQTAYSMLAHGVGCRIEGREIGEGLIKLATRWKRDRTLGELSDRLEDYLHRETQRWLAKGREDRAQQVEDKVEAIRAISASLIAEGKTLISDLVAWIRRIFGDVKPGEKARVVTLSTIHKSKGREWERVYIIERATTLPSPWARKDWQKLQEANLEYVAITRAKAELIYVD